MKMGIVAMGMLGLPAGGWLLALACGLLVGVVVLLAVLWARVRRRLHQVHTDLHGLQQQVVGLSEQLREAEQLHQRELQHWAEQGALAGTQERIPLAEPSLLEAPLEELRSEGAVVEEEAVVQSESAPVSPADAQLLAQVQVYIEQHLSRSELTVEEVSEALGISRVYLYKKLTLLTGRSPVEYIRYQRLLRAADLLRNTALPIGEIGHQVGILNPKKFSHYFKKEYGMVPSAYQRTFSTIGRFTTEQ